MRIFLTESKCCRLFCHCQTLLFDHFYDPSGQDPPRSILLLNKIADKEHGWVNVVKTLIEVIPRDDPLGPAVVTLLIEECPLPSKVRQFFIFLQLNGIL